MIFFQKPSSNHLTLESPPEKRSQPVHSLSLDFPMAAVNLNLAISIS